MALAQVIRFDERQAMGRTRRPEKPTTCVILQMHRTPARRTAMPMQIAAPDEDRIPGRGRDPG